MGWAKVPRDRGGVGQAHVVGDPLNRFATSTHIALDSPAVGNRSNGHDTITDGNV